MCSEAADQCAVPTILIGMCPYTLAEKWIKLR